MLLCWEKILSFFPPKWFHDSMTCLLPDSQCLCSQSQPAGEWVYLHTALLRIVDKCWAYCMTDVLPRKHSLFSLFALFSLCSALYPLMFSKISLVFWYSVFEGEVACPDCEGMETAATLPGCVHGHFLQGKLLRTVFSYFWLVGWLHGRKCNEWRYLPGI